MSKYIDADRLIEYLEKEADKEFKKTEENANSPVLCHFHNGCRMQALDTIDFIKELQQEQPCEDLEEEIKRYIPRDQCPVPDLMEAVARHFAEWQEKQDLRWAAEIYKNGYNLCKEQMLKDAVEGRVVSFKDGHKDIALPPNTVFAVANRYEDGDKVKIVIVKEGTV